MAESRCRAAIRYGVVLVTRCKLPLGHEGEHVGNGLEQFGDQEVKWSPGDRREFSSLKPNLYSWEDP